MKTLTYLSKKNSVVTLFVAFSLMFTGCPPGDEGSNPSLDGTWTSEYGDSFIVNPGAKTLKYDDGFGGGYGGTIEEIVYFNDNGTAGIILIKYTNKPYYYGTQEQPEGNYIGIYFRKLADIQGEFAPPVTEEDWIPAKATLEEAKNSFTEDVMGSYVSYWSVCIKQK